MSFLGSPGYQTVTFRKKRIKRTRLKEGLNSQKVGGSHRRIQEERVGHSLCRRKRGWRD